MSARGRTLRLATRGSELALRQAAVVRDLLATRRLEVVQLRLRHANRQTTDQIYSHLVPR